MSRRNLNRISPRSFPPLAPQSLDPKTAALRAARLARDANRPRIGLDEHHRVFSLGDEMPFGKHRGMTVADILDAEYDYVTWLLESTDFELSSDAEAEYLSRVGLSRR
jgi:tagatose-1,6-bisphosphate aldolase non-catalytic subunit AgaZ/GatZ